MVDNETNYSNTSSSNRTITSSSTSEAINLSHTYMTPSIDTSPNQNQNNSQNSQNLSNPLNQNFLNNFINPTISPMSLADAYVIDYHYGMELTPGNLINISVPCNQANNSVISIQTLLNTFSNGGPSRNVQIIGLVVDQNTIVPLNTQLPALNNMDESPKIMKDSQRSTFNFNNVNENSKFTKDSQCSAFNLNNMDESSKIMRSSQLPAFNFNNVNENSKFTKDSQRSAFNLNNVNESSKFMKDSHLSYMAANANKKLINSSSRPLPPLQLTVPSLNLVSADNPPLNLSADDKKNLPPTHTLNLMKPSKRYNCNYCKFSCDYIPECRIHACTHGITGPNNAVLFDNTTGMPPFSTISHSYLSVDQNVNMDLNNNLNLNTNNNMNLNNNNMNLNLNNNMNLNNMNMNMDINMDMCKMDVCKVCGGNSLRTINAYDNNYMKTSNGQMDSTLVSVCDNCGKEYHLPSNDKIKSKSNKLSEQPPDTPIYERHYCPRCPRSYKHHRDLRKHEKMVHGLNRNQLSKLGQNQPPLVRTMLNQQASNMSTSTNIVNDPSQINYNIEMNSQKMMSPMQNINSNGNVTFVTPQTTRFCDICGKYFRGPFELRRHIQTVHENKRSYRCNICGKWFRDTYEIKRHNISQHKTYLDKLSLGEKLYSIECDDLSQVTLNNDALNLELTFPLNTANTTEEHNDIIFSDIDELNRIENNNPQKILINSDQIALLSADQQEIMNDEHGASSSSAGGEYYCGICLKNFRGHNEFKRHYSIVHERKYRYKCIHCDKKWRDQYDLKRHCRRSHFYGKDIDQAFLRRCLLSSDTIPHKSVLINNHSHLYNKQCPTATNTTLYNHPHLMKNQCPTATNTTLYNHPHLMKNQCPAATNISLNNHTPLNINQCPAATNISLNNHAPLNINQCPAATNISLNNHAPLNINQCPASTNISLNNHTPLNKNQYPPTNSSLNNNSRLNKKQCPATTNITLNNQSPDSANINLNDNLLNNNLTNINRGGNASTQTCGDANNSGNASTQTCGDANNSGNASNQTYGDANNSGNASNQTCGDANNSGNASNQTCGDTNNSGNASTQTCGDANNSGNASNQTCGDASNSGNASNQTCGDANNSGNASNQTCGDANNSGNASNQTCGDANNSGNASNQTCGDANNSGNASNQTCGDANNSGNASNQTCGDANNSGNASNQTCGDANNSGNASNQIVVDDDDDDNNNNGGKPISEESIDFHSSSLIYSNKHNNYGFLDSEHSSSIPAADISMMVSMTGHAQNVDSSGSSTTNSTFSFHNPNNK